MYKRSLCAALIFACAQVNTARADVTCPWPWTIEPAKSHIKIIGTQMADSFEARFEAFKINICFDPDHLSQSHVVAEIETASFASGDADRDDTTKTDAWFSVDAFPVAIFKSDAFEKKRNGEYAAKGNLTIKGVKMPLTLPFSLKIDDLDSGKGQLAVMESNLTLDRSAFELGTGDWADASIIANEVGVNIHIVATHTATVSE